MSDGLLQYLLNELTEFISNEALKKDLVTQVIYMSIETNIRIHAWLYNVYTWARGYKTLL